MSNFWFYVVAFIVSTPFLNFATAKTCEDYDEHCYRWAHEEDCSKDEQLRRECPKSCGVCKQSDSEVILEDVVKSTRHTLITMTVFLGLAVAAAFIGCVKVRNLGGVCRSKGSMKGKIVLITGATSGLGLETAFHLALRGARIIIGCHNLKVGFKVAKDLRNQTGQKLIEVRKLDLALLDSVREFAHEISEQFPKIDVLINNAGIISGPERIETIDNYESTFQVNYLGHFLLTKLLIKTMKDSAPSRILNVVSDEFKKGRINFSDLQSTKEFSNLKAYQNANLAILYFTKELDKVLTGSNVTVNVVDPGLSVTSLRRNLYPYNYRLAWLFLGPYTYIFWKAATMGSETAYYCSLDRDIAECSGRYYKDCEELPYPELEAEIGRKLWSTSERLIQPKKLSTLNQAAIKKALNAIVESEPKEEKKEKRNKADQNEKKKHKD